MKQPFEDTQRRHDISAPPPGARKKKVAIVSTYDEFCGIAGYTRALEIQLTPHVDLTTFDLDQELLRGTNRRLRQLADAHIKEIAERLKEFDCVNIQLEHGTLGREANDIIRHFRMLADAAPALTVTFHTVMTSDPIAWDQVGQFLGKANISAAINEIHRSFKNGKLSGGIYHYLRRLGKKKRVSIIVHTKRDVRRLQNLYRLQNVHHHPLSFISADRAAALRRRTSRADFPVVENLPPDAKLIGTFGFLSPYKGFETVIQSMHFLPDNYHMLIFGGIHPQGIKRQQLVDPYILKLLNTSRIGKTPLDHFQEASVPLTAAGGLESLLAEHPHSLRGRLHFMGALSDDKFYAAMSICDMAVFPYIEVGQSSSGPISIAMEMGARVIASRTATFRAYGRYHPNLIDFFDIGNFAELAGQIMARGRPNGIIPELAYTTDTNVRTYLRAYGFAPQAPSAVAAHLEMAAE